MKRMTIVLGSIAMLLSISMNSMLHADEVVVRDDFFLADESRHQWVNEQNGRTGVLIVSGALLSSPCILETSELELPLSGTVQGLLTRYPLKLDLVGCGDGGQVDSATSPAGQRTTMVIHSALLTGIEGGLLQPEQRLVGKGRAVMHGGSNQLTYFLSKSQATALNQPNLGLIPNRQKDMEAPFVSPRSPAGLLRLRLDYE